MAAPKTVVVVGGGLAGLMATMKLAEAGHKVLLFSVVPVKRSHSVCAQGGINGAVNLRGEGDSPYLHFEDTITGGDFLNHQPPVMRMAERAPAIIYLLDRMGVPFNRTDEGLLSFRRFGGTLKHRTAYAGATTGQQLLYALDEQVRRWEASNRVQKYEGHEFLGVVKDTDGAAKGIVAQDLRTMKIESYAADAVVMATGGNGLIFGKSTNSIINTGAPVSICYQQGVRYGNPEMVQIHPTAIPGEDKCRLISESVRGEGGRVWVPRNPMDDRVPTDIPEAERWYVCEELDSKYGNLLSRDIVSFIIYCVCRMDKGVKGRDQVYLDITQLERKRGGPYTRAQINDKLEGVLEIYEKYMREDPIDLPMRIYPAVHYTMGGLWVDYETNGDGTWDVDSPRNQMTNVPGLYAAGECDYQFHGANRLGANALLSCLVGGEMVAEGIQAYFQQANVAPVTAERLEEARKERQSEYDTLSKSNGKENPYRLHQELAETMWTYCGIWRLQKDLEKAKNKLVELTERAKQCDLLDDTGWNNQAVPFSRAVQNMIEQSKAIVGGALVRDESRGAHFKVDTPERDDKNWLRTTMAQYTPQGPVFDFEPIDVRYLAPRARKYAVNQISIATKLIGPDFRTHFDGKGVEPMSNPTPSPAAERPVGAGSSAEGRSPERPANFFGPFSVLSDGPLVPGLRSVLDEAFRREHWDTKKAPRRAGACRQRLGERVRQPCLKESTVLRRAPPILGRSDGILDRMKRAFDLVEDRLEKATSALAEAGVPYAVIGGLAVAAWVRSVDTGSDRGTPNVDLLVSPGDLDRATVALAKVFALWGGLSFGESPNVPCRSAVRLWPLDKTRFGDDAIARSIVLEGPPIVPLDDLVRAKLALWRRVDRVHLRDLIGNELIPIGLVDATWLDRLPAPLAARLQELLDDPEG